GVEACSPRRDGLAVASLCGHRASAPASSSNVSTRGMSTNDRCTWFEPFFSRVGWEIIADNLSEAGWSWGCVSAVDSNGRTIFTVDAHRGGQHFIVRADEKLPAFMEL